MAISSSGAVQLKRDLSRHIRAGHPWIYADALAVPKGLPTGAAVDILSPKGQWLARGLYDAESPIGVRVWTRSRAERIDATLLRSRVASALSARTFIDRGRTNCWRWLNGEGDFLPGLVADVYDDVVVCKYDSAAVVGLQDWLCDALRTEPVKSIYLRERGSAGQLLWGAAPADKVIVQENGTRFSVDVLRGQKTGFFLDQRDNRWALRAYSAGRRVANLCGYTGGFSVHAALAGATRVVTVDVAAAALADARHNFSLNGLDANEHGFEAVDVFDWLSSVRERFSLMIVDPPSFAPSEKAVEQALASYERLNLAALAVLEPGGHFASASCSSHITVPMFLDMLSSVFAKSERPAQILEVRSQPADHPTLPAFPEGRYLKFVLARVL